MRIGLPRSGLVAVDSNNGPSSVKRPAAHLLRVDTFEYDADGTFPERIDWASPATELLPPELGSEHMFGVSEGGLAA